MQGYFVLHCAVEGPMVNLHVSDCLILPFGRAVKSDLQKISLSAVSADGLYFSTDVPVIFIRKSEKRLMCLGDFEKHFGDLPENLFDADDFAYLDYMRDTLKSNNPNMTSWEEQFLDLYFEMLSVLQAYIYVNSQVLRDQIERTEKKIGVEIPFGMFYKSPNDLWRALLPIPELQLYVQDPLAETKNYQPDNNFRVDYGFWNGEKLIAVEIDGAEPGGYARDIRRDRLLRRAGVDVIHILNLELTKHKARALMELLPRQFFGNDWNYEGRKPDVIPF
jgi:hypothetical protein